MSERKNKAPSNVWKFFTKVQGNKSVAVCGFCLNKFQHGGNTTNLWKHLKAKHQNKIFEVSTLNGTEKSSSDSNPKKRRTEDADSNENSPGDETENKIDTLFAEIRSFEDGGKKSSQVTNALLYMIAVDDRPLQTTEKRGFKKVIKVAVPFYKPPSRKTITSLMDAKYKTPSDKIKSDLKNVRCCSLTTDNWSETSTNKSYLGLTVHYSQPPNITSFNLGCFPLDESHTATYLGTQLSVLCKEWNILKTSVIAVVTDNGSNVVKVVSETFRKSVHLPCIAHTLQLIPSFAMESTPMLMDIVANVKRIVTFFKKSNLAADELRRIQFSEGKTEGTILKVKQEVDTRWNSMYYMLERFILMAKWISSALFTLRNGPPMITQEELYKLEEIMVILRPFEQVTREMSAEDVTCSKTLPIIYCLNMAIDKFKPQTETGIFLQLKILEQIKIRLKNFEEKYPALTKATLLDPRFKKIHFSKSYITVSKAMMNISLEMDADLQTIQEVDCENIENLQENKDDLWSYHDAKALKNIPETEEPGSISSELRNYLAQGFISRQDDPLKYWEQAKLSFPNIYPIAIKYLSIPATSVPCERLFSKAAIIDSKRRSRLTPERLSKLVFLSSIKEEQ